MVGDFPTLNNVAVAYGKTAPIQWMIAQLVNLSEFCGCKDKLSGDQLEELSWLICGEFSYYKVSQFLVFFHDFKMGKYGKFYGAVDPMVITSALKEFDKERCLFISRWNDKKAREEADEERKNAISFAEYLDSLPEQKEEAKYDKLLYEEALAVTSNKYGADERVIAMYSDLFIRNNGMSPQEYVDRYKGKYES